MLKLDEILQGVKRAGIAGHVRPDGDCTGSCLALYQYLRMYYPEVSTDVYLEEIPKFGSIWLTGQGRRRSAAG